MFTDTLDTNGYAIIVSSTSIIPPMAAGKFEAKVTKIYDRTDEHEVAITPENTCMSWGQTEEEAYKKSQDKAKEWAAAQR